MVGRKLVVKISKNYLLILFLMPVFLIYRSDLSIVCDLWHYVQLAVVCYLLIDYFVIQQYSSQIINLLLLFYGVVCVSCIVNSASPMNIIWEMVPDVGICLFIYKAIKKNSCDFIHVAANIFFAYNLINLLTIVLFPEGIASGRIGQVNWFLGGKNVVLPWIVVGGGGVLLPSIPTIPVDT